MTLKELEHILLDLEKPSEALERADRAGELDNSPELRALRGVQQDPTWHPEGDVWIHTMLVIDEAARLRERLSDRDEQFALMLGAVAHDFGKAVTTVFKDGRWRSPGHEARSVDLAEAWLARLGADEKLIEEVKKYCREHMNISHLYKARAVVKPSTIKRLASRIDIRKLALLAEADYKGRIFPGGREKDESVKWMLEKLSEAEREPPHIKPLLTGKILLRLGFREGETLGKVLREALGLQRAGELTNIRQAILWALNRKPSGKK
ncbi:MAG: HD domain-containing protein [Chloroflexota bacterium]